MPYRPWTPDDEWGIDDVVPGTHADFDARMWAGHQEAAISASETHAPAAEAPILITPEAITLVPSTQVLSEPATEDLPVAADIAA